ncbi:hypothetical protein KsCSTR_47970 [Candidatus Kuenenia stuttgartiensis]|uniref:Uncharacterized protein n=1 Tax=Kuenenia stuttgartiensis TaxID=174633 RepID=Q1PVT0_KUEST|nr:hypothetical protein KsCSTR_47970 [Candidatus Kuenenia stuttgartiensis]CAJ71342.1 unknown protein [Candidatus Kuenenia stuttgartiensis]
MILFPIYQQTGEKPEFLEQMHSQTDTSLCSVQGLGTSRVSSTLNSYLFLDEDGLR